MIAPVPKAEKMAQASKDERNEVNITACMIMSVGLLLSANCFAQQTGIAAQYPGDTGIDSDPRVILFDGFETYSQPTDATQRHGGKWTEVNSPSHCSISTTQHFYGAKSYEMDMPICTRELAINLKRLISPTEPRLYMRAYMLCDSGFHLAPQSSHKGLVMSGNYPGPGHAAPRDGSGFFLFYQQNNVEGQYRVGEQDPGYGHVYAYWPYQCDNYGDHWWPSGDVTPCGNGLWLLYPNQYPDFQPRPNFNVPRGQWVCYELMVKLNDLGARNGEVKVWLNGNVVEDFPDLFVRSRSTLQIDHSNLGFHAHHSERVNKIWWDNVVIARAYIGPLVPR